MKRFVRLMLVVAAIVALCGMAIHAQVAGAGQKPPDTQAKPEAQAQPQAQAKDAQAKPAEAKAPELTAEQKAFNAIADEKARLVLEGKEVIALVPFWAVWPFEGPVFLVLRDILNPFLQRVHLAGFQFLARIWRGHDDVGIFGGDVPPEFTLFEVSRRNGGVPFAGGSSVFKGVQAQVRLAFSALEPVAVEAVVSQDGPDIAIEADLRPALSNGERQEPNACEDSRG